MDSREWVDIVRSMFEWDLEDGNATSALLMTATSHDDGMITYNEAMGWLGRIAATIGEKSHWGVETLGAQVRWNRSVFARKLYELAEQLATRAITVDDGVGVLFDMTR